MAAVGYAGAIARGRDHLDHIIAARETMGLPLLFHEMVHVVQYRRLGAKMFAGLHVKGFFAAGGYHGIPLERCALEMEQRFINAPEPFDVEREIAKCLPTSCSDPAGRFLRPRRLCNYDQAMVPIP